MKHLNKIVLLGLALLLAGRLSAVNNLEVAPACQGFSVSGFTLNPQFIVLIVNEIKKNGGSSLTSLPADLIRFNSVVQVSLNNSNLAEAQPYFTLKVADAEGVILDTALSSPPDVVTTTTKLHTGPVSIGAGALTQSGSWGSVAVRQSFLDLVGNNFKDINAIETAVQTVAHHQFTITLTLSDQSGNPAGCSPATYSVPFTLFSQPSGNTSNVPTLIYPNNATIYSALPNFIWTPASSPKGQGGINYRLEVTKDSPSGDLVRIAVPNGQLFYQWTASDPILNPNEKYYWRAIGLDSTGNPIGGNNDSGWTVSDWFQIQPASGAGGVSLPDLDAIVQKALIGSPDLQKILSKMKISAPLDPATLSDDIYNQLKSGQATVSSASVSTH